MKPKTVSSRPRRRKEEGGGGVSLSIMAAWGGALHQLCFIVSIIITTLKVVLTNPIVTMNVITRSVIGHGIMAGNYLATPCRDLLNSQSLMYAGDRKSLGSSRLASHRIQR
jgi:hypothetical protein